MKTTIGGDRLGSGNKQNISLKHYNRSTHDLSYLWRSSMAAGTLVPFMNEVALPGDSFDIDLNCEVMTLPTVGPLFGSYKVQLDVFQVPLRLYNAALHMNKLGIGMDMSKVFLPRMKVYAIKPDPLKKTGLGNADQVNPSCLLSYLGVKGIGKIEGEEDVAFREFNGISLLGYWDIYKNYYANKQEDKAYFIHYGQDSWRDKQKPLAAYLYLGEEYTQNILDNEFTVPVPFNGEVSVVFQFDEGAEFFDPNLMGLLIDSVLTPAMDFFTGYSWNDELKQMIYSVSDVGGTEITAYATPIIPKDVSKNIPPILQEFDLENIDKMREKILQATTGAPFQILQTALYPYSALGEAISTGGDDPEAFASIEFAQEGLGIKTYQSDLFNNWISTEWIDGPNGVNEVTAVSTTGDSFTIDALNLAHKVYNMLNRIAISGGSYDDWLDAVYTHERSKSIESPVYHGSLIRELAFESVVSNADTEINGNVQPLGTLAGRGKLTSKNKGGKIKIKVDEPSYIMGIVSLTPRVDYSQGNKWDMNLMTMNDFHKPALDAIGFQELITEQMAWQSSTLTMVSPLNYSLATRSAGKQPAWINYMTNVNRTYGNFALENSEMFMTLNRRYDVNPVDGSIDDLTTYIDPSKFNNIFAQTSLDAQNFWVQISADITARRKMSAKVIPNL